MKIQKIFFPVLFLLIAVFTFSKGAYAAGLCDFAESNPADCCTNLYPGGDCLDVEKNWYVGSSCLTNSAVTSAISAATSANKQYNCSTGGTICRTDTNPDYILCGATCKLPLIDDGISDGVTSAPHASCAVINRGFDQCTSLCTNVCINGTEVDPALAWTSTLKCRATCPTGEVRSADGTTCLSLDKVSRMLLSTFRFSTLLDFMNSGLATIQSRMDGASPSAPTWYFLRPTATVNNSVPANLPIASASSVLGTEFKYGSGGDPNSKVRLEADYSDMSWALDPANATYAILQEVITEWTGLNLCTIDGDCTVPGETCVGYFCQALGALGDACTDNSDCAAGLYCNAGVCTAISGGGITVAWDGLTATNNYKGDQGGYAGADALCDSWKTGTRVCTVEEIMALTLAGTLDSVTGQGWINGGTPGYTVKANDCDGWKDASGTAFGRWWDFTNKAGWLDQCNYVAGHSFACCH